MKLLFLKIIVSINLNHFKTTMFTGFDTDQSMLRIGAMNMILHGAEAPNIKYQDSLSGDNTERDKYSLIMANPPFTGSLFEEDVSKDLLALCKTKKTELLFVTLFIKMLKVGGRCASIVPDGVLFGSSKAHKNFLSISDFYHFSVLLLHFKTGMGGYCVIEIFVKYYVTSAVTPAANVNSYAYCRWMTCGVLDIYAHD